MLSEYSHPVNSSHIILPVAFSLISHPMSFRGLAIQIRFLLSAVSTLPLASLLVIFIRIDSCCLVAGIVAK